MPAQEVDLKLVGGRVVTGAGVMQAGVAVQDGTIVAVARDELLPPARQVIDVSSTGVQFDFDGPLKVGMKYPISLNAPGVSISTTIEVTRCQLTVEPTGRCFRVSGKFFPYVE